jgi:hypothetical protein
MLASVHTMPPAPAQPVLAFARPLADRQRNVRRPFHPSHPAGRYRLPQDVRERLSAALASFRNRDAAFALAVFIARFWSAPGRVVEAFTIDRRALADRDDLELTEARVRGAIKTLEAVAFLDRAIPKPGSRYQPTEDGLHRKPIFFVFGAEYAPAFIAANERARQERGGAVPTRRKVEPSRSQPAATATAFFLKPNSPKSSLAEPSLNMGELVKRSGFPALPSAKNPLEDAIARFALGVFGKPKASGED